MAGWLILWVVLGLASGWLAERRGLNPVVAFVGGLLLGPLNFLVLLAVPPDDEDEE